jgi:hypothetical protein
MKETIVTLLVFFFLFITILAAEFFLTAEIAKSETLKVIVQTTKTLIKS